MLLLFVLFYAGSNPEGIRSLREFLAFYRENRDLISSFINNAAPMPESPPPKTEEPQAEAKKESRPEEAGKNGMIEEYLKRLL